MRFLLAAVLAGTGTDMPQPGYRGWGELGEVLAGGGGTPGAYEKQLGLAYDTQRKGHSRDKAMEDAAFARNINIARASGLLEKLKGVGYSPEVAALGETLLQGNKTMNLGQLGSVLQRPGADIAISLGEEAMLGDEPDAATYNRMAALAAGKPYQPIRAEGGAYINDGATLGDLDMVPTLPTLTGQMRAEAAIGQGQQRTSAAVAKSERAPASRSGGKAGNPEAVELERARAAVQSGADPGKVADLLRKRGFPRLAKKIYAPGGE